MANLYARLDTDASKNQVTRRGHRGVSTTLETWDGEIRTELEADGSFAVYIGPKNGANICIAEGNVNDGERLLHVPALYQNHPDLNAVTS